MTIILNDDWNEFEQRVSTILENFPTMKQRQVQRLGRIYQAEVKKQITDSGAVDTGRLRSSFGMVDVDESSVIVGTNVYYASWVNDGHRQDRRFVPGRWRSNGTFQYIPYPHNNGQGMMLRAGFVQGRKFMEKAIYRAKPKMIADLENFMNTIKGELGL